MSVRGGAHFTYLPIFTMSQKLQNFKVHTHSIFPQCLLSHSGILTILSPLETRDYMGSVGLRENFTPAPSSQPHTHWQLVTTMQCPLSTSAIIIIISFEDFKSFKNRHLRSWIMVEKTFFIFYGLPSIQHIAIYNYRNYFGYCKQLNRTNP